MRRDDAGDADQLMPKAEKPDRASPMRAAAFPWIGRRAARARADGRQPSPMPSWRRILRIVAGAGFGAGLLAVAAWLAILYLPVPASQVIPRVKAAIEQRLGPDYAVAIADAELQRDGKGVELRLVDLEIAKAGGGPVLASVPRAELELDGLSLLSGEVRVRRVHVTDPKLDLRFDTTVDQASKNSDLPERILKAIGDLDRLLGPDGAAGALQEVNVVGATLLVAPRARAPLSFRDVDLRLARGAGGAIALTAASSRADNRWSSALTVSAANPESGRMIDLGLENIDLAPYSAPFAEKAGASPVAGRLSGHLSARIGTDSKLAAGDGRIEARDLVFTPPAKPADDKPIGPIGVERLQLALNWDPVRRGVVIGPSQIRGKGGQGGFTGFLAAPQAPSASWLVQIDGRDVLLAGETAEEAPLRLDRLDVAASFDPAKGELDVSKAQFLGPTARAAATATVRFEGDSPAVKLGLTSEPMPTSAVKRLWPFFLASSVRSWVIENVGAGTVDGMSLTIDLPPNVLHTLGPHDPLPDGSMLLDIAFSNGVVRGGPALPWLEGAKGRVLSTARKTDVSIERAVVSGGGDAEGQLAVSNVLLSVPDLAPRYPKARLTLKAEGSLRRALGLLGSGAFGANPIPQQIDVAKVSGRVASDVAVDLELSHEDGKAPPPTVSASADMRDVRIAGVFASRNFEKGALQLKVGEGATSLTGKGQVGGAPATVQMVEIPGTPVRRKLNVLLTADAADLQRLGLDIPGSMRGEIPLSADVMLDEPRAPMNVSADLARVGIDGVVPGFKKPAGRPGKLSFVVEKGADKTVIKDFALESGDRSVRGTIEFGPKGDLLSATLPIYRPGPGDDAKVEIDKAKGGVTKVAVQGASLDLKPLLDRVRGKPTSAGAAADKSDSGAVPKDLDVTAKLGTGLGYGGEAIAGLDMKLIVRGGKVTDADGTGRIGSGPISVATGENGRLAIAGGDAGSFFRFADLYGRIDGGSFTLSASLAGGPGVLKINKFSVRNETALETARRATNADQDTPAETRQASAPTRFDKMQVVFVQQSGMIRVSEASVYGPTIGATLEGTVNYAADRVDLVGTFVPMYALNNLVSRVPIIGALLGGGKNGGLVGVTFQVKGGATSPTVSVNPMSVVAPGFFRKLFEFRQNEQGGRAEPVTGSTPRSGADAADR
ncbi:DUF3971 domain-containing protein [Methylopila sp. M107]|uniref:DUF3971 domain-containing protein n=1 Tax=Methylopila sp. M107 TaxID=1101190 RepID=UPI00037F2A2E|nr:DUF3971 domain-containing protein [Methylopila sp. M107]